MTACLILFNSYLLLTPLTSPSFQRVLAHVPIKKSIFLAIFQTGCRLRKKTSPADQIIQSHAAFPKFYNREREREREELLTSRHPKQLKSIFTIMLHIFFAFRVNSSKSKQIRSPLANHAPFEIGTKRMTKKM